MIFQLIFTCALAKSMSHDRLTSFAQDTLDQSREHGISGVTFCKDGSILQILEGEQDKVIELYTSVVKDAHITNPLILIKRELPEGEFSNWSMGYKNAPQRDGIFNLTPNSFADALPLEISSELDTISQTFARVNDLL